jgi:hypothetical protein
VKPEDDNAVWQRSTLVFDRLVTWFQEISPLVMHCAWGLGFINGQTKKP